MKDGQANDAALDDGWANDDAVKDDQANDDALDDGWANDDALKGRHSESGQTHAAGLFYRAPSVLRRFR